MNNIKTREQFIKESYNDDYDENDIYETQHGSVLHEDGSNGYYPDSKVNVLSLGENDVDDPNGGELVPRLAKDFPIDINADVINLISLKYFPSESINGDFSCNDNYLEDLKYCPKIIKGYFDCKDNKIESLEGCPEYVESAFYLDNNMLATLDHINNLKCHSLSLDNNKLLKSIKGISSVETERLYLNGCELITSIDEIPKGLDHLEVNDTGIKSFKCFHDNKFDIDELETNTISDFEVDFYFNIMVDDDRSYEQKVLDHIIKNIEEDEDFELQEVLKGLYLDFSDCDIPSEYSNLFKSVKVIGKFNL